MFLRIYCQKIMAALTVQKFERERKTLSKGSPSCTQAKSMHMIARHEGEMAPRDPEQHLTSANRQYSRAFSPTATGKCKRFTNAFTCSISSGAQMLGNGRYNWYRSSTMRVESRDR